MLVAVLDRVTVMRVRLRGFGRVLVMVAKRHRERMQILQRQARDQNQYGEFSEKIKHADLNANAKMILLATLFLGDCPA